VTKRSKKATKPKESPGTAVTVIEREPVVIEAKLPPTVTGKAAVQSHVAQARELHDKLQADFISGIARIALEVIAAKKAAEQSGVAFASLFGDPDDASKFPFSQSWANRIVRVHERGILCFEPHRLPADIHALDTLASVPEDQRDAVLARYYELTEPQILVAEVLPKDVDDAARKRIADDAEREAEQMAKKKSGARKSMKKARDETVKKSPKAAPKDGRDVKTETREFCAGMTKLMLSEVKAEVERLLEEAS
jgi:hypothetical protein